ncbi:MAG: hypothetical protein ABJL18_00985 [Hyphomicrobiales bacterium]
MKINSSLMAAIILLSSASTAFSKWEFIEDKSDFSKEKTFSVYKEDRTSAFVFRCQSDSELNSYNMKVLYIADIEWSKNNSTVRGYDVDAVFSVDGQAPREKQFFRYYDSPGLAYEMIAAGLHLERLLQSKDRISVAISIDDNIFYEKKYSKDNLSEQINKMPKECVFDPSGYEFNY